MRASEEWLSAVLQTAMDAIITIDARGNIDSLNPAAEEMFGYGADELHNQNVRVLMPPPHHDAHDKYLRDYLETGEAHIIGSVRALEGRKKSGDTFPIELAVSEFKIEGESKFTGIIRDISDRLKAEDLIRTERDRAERYLETAAVMILSLDRDSRVSMINPMGCEILGYSREEVIGQDWFNTFLPVESREETRRIFDTIVAGEGLAVEYYENPILTKSGRQRIIAWHNTELRDESGQIVGALASGTDLTERRENEEEVRRLQREVVDAAAFEQEQIGQELHDDAGQDLRGLAFLLNALGDSLRKQGLAQPAEEVSRIAEKFGETLRKIRALARGLITVDLDEESLAQALQELAYETESRLGVTCKYIGPRELHVIDRGIRGNLYRIAQEAVVNAVRHGNPDCVEIGLTDSDQLVTVTIHDDGEGIPIASLKSEGLGLRIMRHRATLMGAHFNVLSPVGTGTTVTCSLRLPQRSLALEAESDE